MAVETLPMQPIEGDDPIVYSARDLRAHLLANLFSREGVVDRDGGHFKVTQRAAGANYSVDIGLDAFGLAGAAIFGDDQAGQGPYSVLSDSVMNKSVPTPSTTITRTHRVILQTFDRSENSGLADGTYYSDVVVQPDTSAAAALPDTAIPLASIAMPANALSVTNAMITDLRPTATVGTPARTGDAPPWAGWTAVPGRNPKYSITPDGVVLLSGQILRNAATFTTTAGVQYEFGTLPAAIVPNAPRLVTSLGQGYRTDLVMHISPNGRLYFSFNTAQVIAQNTFWIALDGVTYRIAD